MATITKTKVPQKVTSEKKEKAIPRNLRPSVENRPTEEQIRRKAEELYKERLVRGEHGTALDDWHKAEKLLMENQ